MSFMKQLSQFDLQLHMISNVKMCITFNLKILLSRKTSKLSAFQLDTVLRLIKKCMSDLALALILTLTLTFNPHLSWWRPLVWVETSWVSFFVSFSADDQSKSYVSNVSNHTLKSSRWTFSIILTLPLIEQFILVNLERVAVRHHLWGYNCVFPESQLPSTL